MACVLGLPAAGVLTVVVWWSVADYLEARRTAPLDRQRIEELIEKARADSSWKPALEAEYERQKQVSLERDARRVRYAYVILVSSVTFLVCAKWFVSLGGERPPDLEEIRQHRGDSVAHAPKHAGWRTRWARLWSTSRARRNGHPVADEIDLRFVDRIVEEEGRGIEAAIPILQRIQRHYRYLPDEALRRVCELTEITPAQIAGVSSFYAQFRRSPVGRHIIKVCHGTACHVAGAREITEEIRRRLNIAPDADTDADRFFTVDEVACLGCCSLAPVIMIDETTAGKLTPVTACEAIEAFRAEHG
ncbi:MAG: hypothetical protein GXP27_11750 [Planctomycetes bacterium]|nr:hypothetical protein [Planctomycetota bacterium]